MKTSSEICRLERIGADGSAVARHWRDGSCWEVVWENFRLCALGRADGPADLWMAPGLFDVQVNGYGGVDFQRPCGSGELHRAAEALRRDGCERAFLTLITRPWDDLLASVEALREVIRGDARLDAAFPGWHIEGPFLSDRPGFSGAHNPAWMRDPRVGDIQRLKEIVGDDPVLFTLAAERPNAPEVIAEAVGCGFVVSVGHSDASAAQLRAAAEAGASAFTHLANGCPQMLDRHDNILWRVLNEEALVAGIIPDGKHVSPALFRILHRALDESRIYWTTDAMSAASAPVGRYSIGDVELVVGEDRLPRHPTSGGFAGSALEPIEGIRRGAKMLGRRWQDVWGFFSERPAQVMGLPADLAPGSPAGFCLLRQGE